MGPVGGTEGAELGVWAFTEGPGVPSSVFDSLGLPFLPPFLPFLRRDFFSSASLRLLSATSSQGFSPRAILSKRSLWISGLHCSQ